MMKMILSMMMMLSVCVLARKFNVNDTIRIRDHVGSYRGISITNLTGKVLPVTAANYGSEVRIGVKEKDIIKCDFVKRRPCTIESGAYVEFKDLKTRKYNGKTGQIIKYNANVGRWVVALSVRDENIWDISVKEGNLVPLAKFHIAERNLMLEHGVGDAVINIFNNKVGIVTERILSKKVGYQIQYKGERGSEFVEDRNLKKKIPNRRRLLDPRLQRVREFLSDRAPNRRRLATSHDKLRKFLSESTESKRRRLPEFEFKVFDEVKIKKTGKRGTIKSKQGDTYLVECDLPGHYISYKAAQLELVKRYNHDRRRLPASHEKMKKIFSERTQTQRRRLQFKEGDEVRIKESRKEATIFKILGNGEVEIKYYANVRDVRPDGGTMWVRKERTMTIHVDKLEPRCRRRLLDPRMQRLSNFISSRVGGRRRARRLARLRR